MARPIWKGHVTFGLVMIPVVLYSGENSQAEIDLDLLDARDHSRVRYQRVNEKSGKEVPWKSIVKGVKTTSGEYIILEPEDYKAAARDVVKGDVEVIEFVEQEEISPLLYEKPYYLLPGAGGTKVYNLFRDVLVKSKRVGIANTIIQTRQHLAAIMPAGKTLALMTMRFGDELREPKDFPLAEGAGKSASPTEIAMAKRLVDELTVPFDVHRHHDRYREALKKIIAQKSKGVKPKPADDDAEVPDTYNILELLQRSVSGAHPRTRAGNGHAKKTARSRTQRKAG